MSLTQVHQLTQIGIELLGLKLKTEHSRREASIWKELICKYKASTAKPHSEVEQKNENIIFAGDGVGRTLTEEEHRNAMTRIEDAWKDMEIQKAQKPNTCPSVPTILDVSEVRFADERRALTIDVLKTNQLV